MFDAYRPSLCSAVPEGVGPFSCLSTTTVSVAKKGGDGGRRGGEKGRWENRPGRGLLRGEAALQSFPERGLVSAVSTAPLPPLLSPSTTDAASKWSWAAHTEPRGLLLCLQSRPGWGKLTDLPRKDKAVLLSESCLSG